MKPQINTDEHGAAQPQPKLWSTVLFGVRQLALDLTRISSMPASQRTRPKNVGKKSQIRSDLKGNFSLARGRRSGSESVEENYEGEPNGAWRDDRGASSAPGSAAGPHRSDLPSRSLAGYGRHIWNSGGCRAEALPQVSVSKTHTWDKLRKSRRVPYYCSSLPPSVT